MDGVGRGRGPSRNAEGPAWLSTHTPEFKEVNSWMKGQRNASVWTPRGINQDVHFPWRERGPQNTENRYTVKIYPWPLYLVVLGPDWVAIMGHSWLCAQKSLLADSGTL